MHTHAVQQHKVDAWELEVEEARVTPNKKPKVEHPPLQRIPLAPPNPRDVESAVNGGNYDLDDLRELRDLPEEKVRTQAASRQSTPVSG